MKKKSQLGPWISSSTVSSFVIQQIISTAGAMLLGAIVTLILAALTAAFTKGNSSGNFVDQLAHQYISRGMDQPYYVAPVLVGFALGTLSRHFFRKAGTQWLWVLPLCILLWSIYTWRTGGYGTYWQSVWDNYFGSDCEGSECAYEFFVTVPFYTSLAYSVGWLGRSLLTSRTERPAQDD